MLMNWKIDAETQKWVDAFNARLAEHTAAGRALVFDPESPFDDSGNTPGGDSPDAPLLVLTSALRFKYVYYISGACLVMALVVLLYTLPLALSGQVEFERMAMPTVLAVMLVIFGLAYGLPAFLYLSRREILLFSDHMALARRDLRGHRKIRHTFPYKDLQSAAVGYNVRDESRYDADAGYHSPDYSSHWAYCLDFRLPGGKTKRRIISAYQFAQAQEKMTFWQNNLVFVERDTA